MEAGINFSKYDNIEVTAEGGTGREQPIGSFQDACDLGLSIAFQLVLELVSLDF